MCGRRKDVAPYSIVKQLCSKELCFTVPNHDLNHCEPFALLLQEKWKLVGQVQAVKLCILRETLICKICVLNWSSSCIFVVSCRIFVAGAQVFLNTVHSSGELWWGRCKGGDIFSLHWYLQKLSPMKHHCGRKRANQRRPKRRFAGTMNRMPMWQLAGFSCFSPAVLFLKLSTVRCILIWPVSKVLCSRNLCQEIAVRCCNQVPFWLWMLNQPMWHHTWKPCKVQSV